MGKLRSEKITNFYWKIKAISTFFFYFMSIASENFTNLSKKYPYYLDFTIS